MTGLVVALGAALLLGCPGDSLETVHGLLEQGQYIESLELLEALLEERPDDPELQYLYGTTSVVAGRASQGIWSLRRAREFEGWEIRAGVELARAGIHTGDNALSLEAATRVLELEPDQRPALDIRAEALVRAGDYEGALVDVARLRELAQDDGEVEILALRTLIGLRRIEDAEALFTDLEERRAAGSIELPAERYCTAQAVFASERGEIDLARQTFDACLESHPANAMVLESALEFFDAQRDYAHALEILDHALAEQPTSPQIRQYLAQRLRAGGRPDEAERVLLEGTRLEPDELAATSWGALGAHYFELEDFAAAAAAWSRLIDLVPEPGTEILATYAEALALAGEHDRALEIAAGLPDSQRHLLEGRVLLEQRRAEPALEAFDAAIRLWPDNAVARYFAARAAERTGDFDRAISEYRASVRTDAGATDAGLRLARLHLSEGRLEPARVALSHHLRTHPTDPEALVPYFRLNLRLGQRSVANQTLMRLAQLPGERGRALAEAAQSLARIQGEAEAADLLLRESREFDLTHLTQDPLLRGLIDHLTRSGHPEQAVSKLKSLVDADPDNARLHEIYALALEQDGSPATEVLASLTRSLELDPDHAPAWRAIARLRAQAGDVKGASEACERARSGSAPDSLEAAEIGVECARWLVAGERAAEAGRLLEDVLWWHPLDAQVAALLSRPPIAQDPSSERALELARRANRFGRGS